MDRRAGRAIAVPALFVAVLAAAWAAPAASERSRVDLSYEVYVGGLLGGRIDGTISRGPADYAVEARGETVGLLGYMFPWSMQSYSRGRVERQRIVPAASGQKNSWRGRERFVDIVFAGEVPEVVRSRPRRRDDIGPELKRGAVDPISGALVVIVGVEAGRGCDAAVPVFDGRRLYDMVAVPDGVEELPATGYSSFSGPAVKCLIRFRKTRGPDEGSPRGLFRRPAEVWLAPPFDGAPPVPVRLRMTTRLGGVVAHLVDAGRRTPDGARSRN